MKTMTKWQLPLLAVATLLVAACDPFPSKDTAAPSVVRVIASGTNYIEVDAAAVANPAAITVDAVDPDAVLFIQFSKDMDGSSIQAAPNYDANFNPVPTATACALAGSPLTLSANFDPATLVCYYPSAATDGGQIYVLPGDLLVSGQSYTVDGTVRDLDGHSLVIGVTFNVP